MLPPKVVGTRLPVDARYTLKPDVRLFTASAFNSPSVSVLESQDQTITFDIRIDVLEPFHARGGERTRFVVPIVIGHHIIPIHLREHFQDRRIAVSLPASLARLVQFN